MEISRGPTQRQVVAAFVGTVVLPRYTALVQQSESLCTALDRLAGQPTQAHLLAARSAWLATRRSWEAGESWAFGPASTQGFDGNLDDWPVNERDLQAALRGGTVSPELFARLTTTARGFHGIEYVLFGPPGSVVRAGELGPGQRSYLQRAGADLVAQARGLRRAWEGPGGYGASLGRSEGEGAGAVAEILQGMVGTLQEVADEKLGKPLAARDPASLESFYSGTTQADVVANLAGIEATYTRSGLRTLLTARDPGLARSITGRLQAALRQARALPPRLNDQLGRPGTRAQLQQLMDSARALAALIENAAQELA